MSCPSPPRTSKTSSCSSCSSPCFFCRSNNTASISLSSRSSSQSSCTSSSSADASQAACEAAPRTPCTTNELFLRTSVPHVCSGYAHGAEVLWASGSPFDGTRDSQQSPVVPLNPNASVARANFAPVRASAASNAPVGFGSCHPAVGAPGPNVAGYGDTDLVAESPAPFHAYLPASPALLETLSPPCTPKNGWIAALSLCIRPRQSISMGSPPIPSEHSSDDCDASSSRSGGAGLQWGPISCNLYWNGKLLTVKIALVTITLKTLKNWFLLRVAGVLGRCIHMRRIRSYLLSSF